MTSNAPEPGKSSQRLCGYANLYDVTLQELIVKQQSGVEPSPQRRQLKYDAKCGIFLTIFEVFGKVLTHIYEYLI